MGKSEKTLHDSIKGLGKIVTHARTPQKMDLHIRGEIRAYFKHSIEYGLENLKTSRHVEKYDEAPRHVEKI